MPHNHDVRRCKKCAAILALDRNWHKTAELTPAEIERHRRALSKKELEALFTLELKEVFGEVWPKKRKPKAKK